jgi:glutamyl-Q tRNA(Asp) synthetase
MVRPDLQRLAGLVGTPPVTRYAPSPTGYLHLGHVVNAIYVWGIARALGGRVLLRVEDHDRIRCRPEYEAALLEDLNWLGFVPDDGLEPLRRQSDDHDAYRSAVARLRQTAHIYACDCSRKDIGGEVYTGRCRNRGLAEAPGRGLRVEMADGVERIDDLLLGPLEQAPSTQCGDLLVRDRDGHWTYQLAVTVDDDQQGVTLVIRGEDLVSSTGRQIRLARMLGRRTPPLFAHHPLIIGASGEKLSKANRDTGVRELRRLGLDPAEVIGRAALEVGLIERSQRIAATEVVTLFPR